MFQGFKSVFAFAAIALGASVAQADCGCEFTVVNGLNGAITVTRIQTSDAGVAAMFFKEQWTGSVHIQPGAQHRFNFTVNGGCGNKHRFQFTKNDGRKCQTDPVNCGGRITCSSWF